MVKITVKTLTKTLDLTNSGYNAICLMSSHTRPLALILLLSVDTRISQEERASSFDVFRSMALT